MKRDRKLNKRFKKSIKKLSKQIIQVGAIGQHDGAGMPNADLLAIHEFGTDDGKIPPRAPIRKTFKNNSNLKQISNTIQGLMKANFDPKKAAFKINKITDGIGLTMQQMTKRTIKGRVEPGNAESTLANKKGDVPLIDTGQLVNSIGYGVRTK